MMAWKGQKQRAHGPGAFTQGHTLLEARCGGSWSWCWGFAKDGRLPPALGFMGTSQAPEGVSLLTEGENDPLPHRRNNVMADLILVVGPTGNAKGWRVRGVCWRVCGVCATMSEQRYFLFVPSSFA